MSPACSNLLAGLLETQPAERVTLPQAMQHPWLVRGLPAELASLNACLYRLRCEFGGRYSPVWRAEYVPLRHMAASVQACLPTVYIRS